MNDGSNYEDLVSFGNYFLAMLEKKKELLSFGQYLLSDQRRKNFENHPDYPNDEAIEERLSQVHDTDIDHWKASTE